MRRVLGDSLAPGEQQLSPIVLLQGGGAGSQVGSSRRAGRAGRHAASQGQQCLGGRGGQTEDQGQHNIVIGLIDNVGLKIRIHYKYCRDKAKTLLLNVFFLYWGVAYLYQQKKKSYGEDLYSKRFLEDR